MEHKKSTGKMANAIKRSPEMQTLRQKVGVSQQGATSTGNTTLGAGSSSQRGAAEKSTEDRDSPIVINIPINSPSSEPAVLACLWRERTVLAYRS
jgi:hypothetical protein